MRIGLITDTHLPAAQKTLWPEVTEAFAGCDLVWHGGDIVRASVLDELEAIAPTFAALGNNDVGIGDPRCKRVQRVEAHGVRLAMVHDMEPEDDPIDELIALHLGGKHADIVVSGHTHFERLAFRDGVLQINTGSAVHPHLWSTRLGTVGIIDIEPAPAGEPHQPTRVTARIIRLGETEGLRNPGAEYRFDGAMVDGRLHEVAGVQ